MIKVCGDCEWFENHPEGGRCHEPSTLHPVNSEDEACEFYDGLNNDN